MDGQPDPVANAFARHLIYDEIFSSLSAASLMRMRRVSRSTYGAVQDFTYRAFDVNRLLSRFISDPHSFRSLQARTATLISGSLAIQFFDRTFYPESDLDLYVYKEHVIEVGIFLLNDGYQFAPYLGQANDFYDALNGLNRAWIDDLLAETVALIDMPYRYTCVGEVFTFKRRSHDTEDSNAFTKVQIIVPRESSLQLVLGSHSTCVMNFITYNTAVSLYPVATFERRESLVIEPRSIPAFNKYISRGWTLVDSPLSLSVPLHEGGAGESDPFLFNKSRWVTGRNSWVMHLDTEGVQSAGPLSASSTALTWDPVVECSWALHRLERTVRVWYYPVQAAILRYRYIVADWDYLERLTPWFNSQVELEYSKLPKDITEPGGDYWTWWDSELPRCREAYWQSLEARTADVLL